MSTTADSIIRFRPDSVTNLPNLIWEQIADYNGNEWELPKEKESLEELVGSNAAEALYAIGNSAECNIRLREIISPYLKHRDMQVRLAAMEWVVYDWGNVRGKSEKHEKWPRNLGDYSPEVVNNFISANYQDRIASWSKVLGFAESETYAIYDARVAMSLNATLDNTNYKGRFYLPPPSSDKLKPLFRNIKKHVADHYKDKQVNYMGYFDYMDLLNAFVDRGFALNVLEAEMKLFAHGMTFAEQSSLLIVDQTSSTALRFISSFTSM